MTKLALALALLLVFSACCFASCSGGEESGAGSAVSEPEESSGPEETSEEYSEPEESPEESSGPEESSEPEETSEEYSEPEEESEPESGGGGSYGLYDPNAVKYIDSVEDPSKVGSIPMSYLRFPNVGEYYGRLSCGRIGLNVAVFFGDDNWILNNGAGQSRYSFPPGFGRTILLSGHNISFFNPLQYAEPGDVFVFDVNYETYEYRVISAGVENAESLDPKFKNMLLAEKETLVMYTCYPFNAWHTVPDRFVVYCERIKGLDVKWRG